MATEHVNAVASHLRAAARHLAAASRIINLSPTAPQHPISKYIEDVHSNLNDAADTLQPSTEPDQGSKDG